MSEPTVIETDCEVMRIATMESGAIRVTFDLPESSVPQAALLMHHKNNAPYLYMILSDSRQSLVDSIRAEAD